MSIITEELSQFVWERKYRYQQGDIIIDHHIEDTWTRVARAVASAEPEKTRSQWQKAFYDLLEGFRFLPGGRILAGAGTQHQVTLLNCFVIPIEDDSLIAIFKALQEGALTLQQGGGVGYDFSVLRPQGDPAMHVGAVASGPISFMHIWDSMCHTMLSTGARRGAMMGVLRCDHPDIEAFISAKRESHALKHFNLSVMVSDAFMAAVARDEPWALIFPGPTSQLPSRVYRYVRARELWDQIMHSAYETAEPGVLFEGTINRTNNLSYKEWIQATNPCGEIPLPAYGACNLGAINLTQFVAAPFSPQATINWEEMETAVRVATRFLDNVIDVSGYPLAAQRQQSLATRRIGLGVTGLADTLILLGLAYDSAAALSLARDVMKRIAEVTWHTSIELAREKGVFPDYDAKAYLDGAFVQALDNSILKQLKQFGVRNSHHNAIAPTGTISALANTISNGIEPVYCATYQRHVQLAEEKAERIFTVNDYAYTQWRQQGNNATLPPAWRDAQILLPESHLQMQATMQAYVDNAISKTINIPADFPFEKLETVYTRAYALGLKGCTVFRPNAVRGSVLEADSATCCAI